MIKDNSDRERKPADRERKPADRERKPADRERKPADRERKPADRERKPAAIFLHGLLFFISSKGSFKCTIPQTG